MRKILLKIKWILISVISIFIFSGCSETAFRVFRAIQEV